MINQNKKTSKAFIFGGLFLSSLLMTSLYAQDGPPPPPNGDGGRPGGAGDRPGGGPGNGGGPRDRPAPTISNLENAQENLQVLIAELNLTAVDPQVENLPTITDDKAQLGKQLFFAKNLGGEQSAACVSCHHPTLGGGDQLSLPVGVSAVNELEQSSHDLLGHGRYNGDAINNLPSVPRNSPTVFNLGLNNRALFWDGRVERRRGGIIVTPDSPIDGQGRKLRDPNLPENTTLAAAQARFPVTSPEEMRGNFLASDDNQNLRTELTTRFTNSVSDFSSNWPASFVQAFGDNSITFNRIAEAIGEYERSMVFVNNPWKAYLEGDNEALSQEQKAGAVLFFASRRDGGAGCSGCHRGQTFASNRHHLVAYPQIGPGKGNDTGTNTSNDFGRENINNQPDERFHFRAPSLLNIAVTAPYGHTGAYQTLEEVVAHYNDPRDAINRLFSANNNEAFSGSNAPFCQLTQIRDLMTKNGQSCEDLYPDAYQNSMAAVLHLEQARDGTVEARAPLRGRRNLSPEQVSHVAAFMRALTDPCVTNRACLEPWLVDESDRASYPDDLPLIATDKNENSL
jgi:cytochrome c peroxidase